MMHTMAFKRSNQIMSVHLFLGIVIGGVFGYAIYYFVGCSSGTCPITANPWVSTLVGTMIGAMLSRLN
jgi:L-cystine uptake protein TcyP (sodium:dicarboxylate symporter family)